jgi:hypothetical protein
MIGRHEWIGRTVPYVRPIPFMETGMKSCLRSTVAVARIIGFCLLSASCADETHPELPIESRAADAASTPTLAAPALERSAETPREALERIYHDALVPDPRGALRGDFNGDGWEDVAILARPAPSKIAVLNGDLADWIIRDALSAPDPSKPRPSVRTGDQLLAVIHGYGREGWRHPQARQTFLMVNAATRGMEVRSADQVIPAAPGRVVRGDVITGARDGTPGFLFWAGSRYIWHSSSSGYPRSQSSN